MLNKTKKIIIIILNLTYLVVTLGVLLVLYEYAHDIFSDFFRFKMMHSLINIFGDIAATLLWVVFSIVAYKYNKNLIAKDRIIAIYSIIPLVVILIIVFSVSVI